MFGIAPRFQPLENGHVANLMETRRAPVGVAAVGNRPRLTADLSTGDLL